MLLDNFRATCVRVYYWLLSWSLLRFITFVFFPYDVLQNFIIQQSGAQLILMKCFSWAVIHSPGHCTDASLMLPVKVSNLVTKFGIRTRSYFIYTSLAKFFRVWSDVCNTKWQNQADSCKSNTLDINSVGSWFEFWSGCWLLWLLFHCFS
jgi:hypothetical protein